MTSENFQLNNSSFQTSNELMRHRSTGVKRLLNEAKELCRPNELFHAQPLEENLFEWHFTVRGPPDTVYSGGIYHGRILLPVEYPMKPPNLRLLTPNGRFETNKNICLRPTHSAGALGSLECSAEERQRLAILSLNWHCSKCGLLMRNALPQLERSEDTERLIEEVKILSHSTPDLSNEKNSSSANIDIAATIESIVEGVVNSTDNSLVNSETSIQELQQQTFADSNSIPITQQTIQTSNSFLFDNTLIWIFILIILFFALFFRRLLTQNIDGQFQQNI
ncbi:UBIQUITIN_CONJUGAT_2 domain-containing protein [Meloidogyne graminicola]|uniref:UBIQUITIN_CONJUGAT_2 domain-containing protein n=1 Tax=Meloidogyne graminicola TaxID=189291 RepID=A0A8S9ZSY3_9BILA|nr:UBIQUITIN_CONJUGAT_2 domain-containing protein [Meloidogyne graminicola]